MLDSAAAGARRRIGPPLEMKIVLSIFRSFIRHDCLNLAENIAFGALLAIIPIGMMMVSIAGYFLGGSADAFDQVVAMATNILPVGRDTFAICVANPPPGSSNE